MWAMSSSSSSSSRGGGWFTVCCFLFFISVDSTAAAGLVGGGDSASRDDVDTTEPRVFGAIPSETRATAGATAAAAQQRRTSVGSRIAKFFRKKSEKQVGEKRQREDGKPEVDVSREQAGGDGRQQPFQEEDVGQGWPGDEIEEMAEDWTEHTSTRAWPGAVLSNAHSVYSEISEEILTRWGHKYANTPLFSGGMRFSDGGTVVENKFLNAVLEQKGFVAAFTGISTTAAHDCLYEQSFPVLLNETMGRLMSAAGVRFEAINVAMGNTRVAPYSYCVDAHAGLNADIISWDMSMVATSYACGRAAAGVELFIRTASSLPRRPAVLLTDAFPDQESCTNGHLHLFKKLDSTLTGDCDPDRDLLEVYRDFGLHQISPRSLVPEVTCGDDLFARARLFNRTEKDYPAPVRWHAGPTGHVLVGDMLFMHYAAVLMSALERLDAVRPGITAAGLRQHESLSELGRNSLRESLGLGAGAGVGMGVGVTSANADRGGGSAAPDNDNNSDERDRSSSSSSAAAYMGGGRGDILPPPAWCKGLRFCDWAGSYRCANTYSPLAGRGGSRLLDMVSGRTPPVLNRDHSENFVEPSPGRWAVTLNEEVGKLKAYLKMPPPDGFHHPIDMKWVLVGNKDSGPIEFEFETLGARPREGGGGHRRRAAMVVDRQGGTPEVQLAASKDDRKSAGKERSSSNDRNSAATTTPTPGQGAVFDSRITICKPDFIDRVAFNETSGVRFSVDGVQVSVVELAHHGLHEQSCVLLDADVGVGRHTVRVEPLEAGERFVAISHVVYPA
ncbi:unnamed protein product [Pylaiella littoralis]